MPIHYHTSHTIVTNGPTTMVMSLVKNNRMADSLENRLKLRVPVVTESIFFNELCCCICKPALNFFTGTGFSSKKVTSASETTGTGTRNALQKKYL